MFQRYDYLKFSIILEWRRTGHQQGKEKHLHETLQLQNSTARVKHRGQ